MVIMQSQSVQRHDTSPVYIPSFLEKIMTFFEGIGLFFSRKKVLVVGPYVGEFGHEIMDFQSYVRQLAMRYDTVHVISYPGMDPLYRGCIMHSHDYELKSAGYYYGKLSFTEIKKYAMDFARKNGLKEFDLFNTTHLCTRWHRKVLYRQQHEVFRAVRQKQEDRDIVFHFRNIFKDGPDDARNFKPGLVEELVRLCSNSGYSLVCIGHPDYSLCPRECEDRRTVDLEETIAVIASGKVVVGELSGPIHLAVYCSKQVITWAPGKSRIKGVVARNPFNIPIHIVRDDTTNPVPFEILNKIDQVIGKD